MAEKIPTICITTDIIMTDTSPWKVNLQTVDVLSMCHFLEMYQNEAGMPYFYEIIHIAVCQ